MSKRVLFSVVLVWLFGVGEARLCPGQTASGETMPFRQVGLPVERRVDDLVGRMTVDEKIGELMMASAGIPRLGVPAYHWWNEGLHGIARDGVATVFPQAIGLAATWDPMLQQKIGGVIAEEARAKNNAVIAKTGGASAIYQGLTIWSPNINIFRDPRWGRGQETYGEDPYLTARFGVAFVKGLQGDDPKYLETVATLKHFAVHSGPEELRHKFNAVVSDRDLHETYLPAFEAGIREGGAKSVMSAYNAVDGVPAPANTYLLQKTLRDSWGFTGAVVGDVDTVADIWKPGTHEYAKDAAEASADALKAGTDLCSGTTYKALPEALKRGLVTEKDIDVALKRLMTLRFELGQFDPAEDVKYRAIPESVVASDENGKVALQASRESLVLLKNDGTLPWKASEMKTLVVLGPTADDGAALIGNYAGKPKESVTILKGLREKLEPMGVKVVYAPVVPVVEGFSSGDQVVPAGVLFTDETKTTPGLVREVFKDSMKEPAVAKDTDGRLDVAWNPAEPAPGIPVTGAVVRWTGVLVAPVTTDYVLSVNALGMSRLFVNDKLMAETVKEGDPGKAQSIVSNVRMEAGKAYRVRVEYRQGSKDTTGKVQLRWVPPTSPDDALAALKTADHILLVLGVTPDVEGEEKKQVWEGFSHGDRTTIQLPKVQQELIAKVAALGKPFTVVLTGSASLVFDYSKPDAVLMAWYYGQAGGQAIAETLLGEVNPSGHLPVTFYASDKDLPSFTDYSMKGRTYRYFAGKAMYPFGYGLSYTTFGFSGVGASAKEVGASDVVDVGVTVKNVGAVAGDDVVQVYGREVKPKVEMPLESLVGFVRVSLKAGEEKTVVVPVQVESLRRWDEKGKVYVVDKGEWELRVGDSSADVKGSVGVVVR